MPGNSQRRGAVRKRGKGNSGKGNTAGSGGRIRRSLEGRGPTPKAEDRPYDQAHKRKQQETSRQGGQNAQGARGARGARTRPAGGAEWVVGRNPVLEVIEAGEKAVREGATGHIVNLGHGVLPGTDPDALTRLVEWVHEH